jgi:NADP-dependent 3-hydroxy acid dehydrogenase YdfG
MSTEPVVIVPSRSFDVSFGDVMGVSMKLKDKVALVTGTSPNIGGGIAEALAAEGATLVCVDALAANATDCANYLKKIGGKALGITCDVTDEGQVSSAVGKACEAFGRVDVLVNNAVQFNKKGVLTMPLEEWRRQVDVILTGAFLFTKYCAQSMINREVRGNILNIGSTAGHQGEPNNVGYSTAKSGILNFTRSTAMELGQVRHSRQQPDANRDRPVGDGGACPALGTASARHQRFIAEISDVPKPHPDAEAAETQRLRPRRGLHGVVGRRVDDRHRPADRCGSDRTLLAVGPCSEVRSSPAPSPRAFEEVCKRIREQLASGKLKPGDSCRLNGFFPNN